MGLRGPRAQSLNHWPRPGEPTTSHPWEAVGLSRAERVVAFVESLPLTSGQWAGQSFRLRPWQKRELRRIYRTDADGRRIVRTVCWSTARANGKTGLASVLALAHLVGPESQARGECYCAANDKFQASRLFSEVVAIIERVPWLAARMSIRRHEKTIEDHITGSILTALSADVPTKHGLAPNFVVMDELGQSQSRELLDTLQTSLGKKPDPMLWIISTQAATDAMPMSQVIDYGLACQRGEIADPSFHLYLRAAPLDADPWSIKTWRLANPGLDDIASLEHIKQLAKQAKNMPSAESNFRRLHLNQRVAISNYFVTPDVWKACGSPVDVEALRTVPVYAGLDLSAVADLTALVLIGKIGKIWHVLPTCWLPSEGLIEKARADRVPYDQWARQGFLQTTPGRTIAYDYIADHLRSVFDNFNVRKLAFDAWGMNSLKLCLSRAGFSEQFIAEKFVEYRQGFKSMSPALRDLEQVIREGELAHGNNPLLTMCMMAATVVTDDAGNRKLSRDKSTQRIDAAVSLAMAIGVAPLQEKPFDVESLIG
jgi:phage terminase large subunit-like protein